MKDKAMLFLANEELLTLAVLAIEGFKTMITEHVNLNHHDIGRLVKCAVLIHKIEEECTKVSEALVEGASQ